jgi:hypothetical protein
MKCTVMQAACINHGSPSQWSVAAAACTAAAPAPTRRERRAAQLPVALAVAHGRVRERGADGEARRDARRPAAACLQPPALPARRVGAAAPPAPHMAAARTSGS